MVQNVYRNWLLVSKISLEIWTISGKQWKVQKSWNLMGYFRPKSTFLQLKHYIQRMHLTLLSTTRMKVQKISYVIFETMSHFSRHNFSVFFLAQSLHTFEKSSPSKWKFSDFSLLALKCTRFRMPFFKLKLSFSSKFGSLFSVMRDNSSVLF